MERSTGFAMGLLMDRSMEGWKELNLVPRSVPWTVEPMGHLRGRTTATCSVWHLDQRKGWSTDFAMVPQMEHPRDLWLAGRWAWSWGRPKDPSKDGWMD